ncbi:pyridoxamine 5'-phosphate oxidase family protein [Rhodococcus sp. HNM0569]|uniref:pyridoxamine 5'-phosphate oxidase family protein n=1 Tax=Rhodococcus sp. HNM0569 TaxID=2716340 RepID=UPI00146B32FD|nr:pyridoxamine 5'-phosphate oxidase family protein [Rhodococcus sp. HNM0569]NLU83218.1 pyridoxamine 5'-phosphate oxidase family protein [Rhodococcus sp. HNM0569]
MTDWKTFDTEAPQLARAVAARLHAHKHHVLATLRRDGSPRVSGTEVEIYDGTLLLGSMPDARKVQDLRRDPRYALHSNPGHHSMDGGDAKITGRARELSGAEKKRVTDRYPDEIGAADVFALDVEEVVLTTVAGNGLHVDLWRPGAGVQRFTRT